MKDRVDNVHQQLRPRLRLRLFLCRSGRMTIDPRCELRNGGRLNESAHWNRNLESIAYPSKDGRSLQGIAAKIEIVILYAHAIHAQHRAPNLHYALLCGRS